jgi:hypothetical protein
LWDSPAAVRQQAALARYRRLATVPFDPGPTRHLNPLKGVL